MIFGGSSFGGDTFGGDLFAEPLPDIIIPPPSSGISIEIDNDWPTGLPLPLIEYSGEPRFSTIIGPDDAYIVGRRSRFTRSYASLSVSWCFSRPQFAQFKSFFLNDLGNGSAQFKLELRYPYNTQLTQWAVRIADSYKATYQEGYWLVVAVLDLVNPIVLVESELSV